MGRGAVHGSGMPFEELQRAGDFLGPLYYIAFKVPLTAVATVSAASTQER